MYELSHCIYKILKTAGAGFILICSDWYGRQLLINFRTVSQSNR